MLFINKLFNSIACLLSFINLQLVIPGRTWILLYLGRTVYKHLWACLALYLFKPCEGNCFYFPCEGKYWTLPYFGVLKVTVIPPTDLIHPVLPLKCNGKLKFTLCHKCACLENKEMCKCLDSD